LRRFNARRFTAAASWDGPTIATIGHAAVKLRWTDRPFRWHVNDGEEVFVVIDGTVDMHVRDAAGEHVITLNPGELLHVEPGEEHVAHPRGPARILVIEQEAGG
jgi:mannose-6-phosphate isomerase-like protein (cupin superfamily)